MKRKNELSYYLETIKAARDKGANLRARRYGETALSNLTRLGRSPTEEYNLYDLMHSVYYNLAEYSRSLDVLYKAGLVASKHSLSPAYIAFSALRMGNDFLIMRNYTAALRQFQKVEQYYKEHGYDITPMNKSKYVTTMTGLAYCYLYKNELDMARVIMDEKHAVHLPSLSNDVVAIDYHHFKGEYQMALKEYDKARASFRECVKISERINHPGSNLEAQMHLAMLDIIDGEVDSAINILQGIQKNARRLKLNDLICEAGLLLSRCHYLKGSLKRAEEAEIRIKPLLTVLDTVWLYEKSREFDQFFRQLLDDKPGARYGPHLIVDDIIDKQHKTSPYKNVIVGQSPAMQDVYHVIDKIAPTDLPVLIQGETGTGKELICRLIHRKSLRSEKPYLAINCGAMPENLLENELFGHIKGAFTGALENKQGYIELASGGTLMLDEITNMSAGMQRKLLRVLEEQQVWPLGAEKSVPVNTRFIFVSNQNVEQMVSKGLLRNDLFFRINTIIITLPPLKERRDDIPLLVEHFLKKYRREMRPSSVETTAGRDDREKMIEISHSALDILTAYPWPGNVRELENEVQKTCILQNDAKVIDESMLPEHIRDCQVVGSREKLLKQSGRITMAEMEKEFIGATFKSVHGNITRAAEQLGYTHYGLSKKLKALGLR